MAGKVIRAGVAALSAAAIVAGGSALGAGTASAQSEEFASSVEQRNLTAVFEWTPEQWAEIGLNLAVLPLWLALGAAGSVDIVVVPYCGLYHEGPCPASSPVEQVLDWAGSGFGS